MGCRTYWALYCNVANRRFKNFLFVSFLSFVLCELVPSLCSQAVFHLAAVACFLLDGI